MPLITEEKKLTVEQILTVGFECDRCKKIVYKNSENLEILEYQERLVLEFTGGFQSVWGDRVKVEIVLCQQCGHDLFKDFAKTKEPDWYY
ncbi:MAG TPA: hypothetical protein PLP33_25300 [Leptospiraceae bacterium]|nr:hypothetical protein [Leptospiraceae bacterium]